MLLPFPNLLAHFLISTSVKGLISLVGLTLLKGFLLSTVNRDSKNVVIISVFVLDLLLFLLYYYVLLRYFSLFYLVL